MLNFKIFLENTNHQMYIKHNYDLVDETLDILNNKINSLKLQCDDLRKSLNTEDINKIEIKINDIIEYLDNCNLIFLNLFYKKNKEKINYVSNSFLTIKYNLIDIKKVFESILDSFEVFGESINYDYLIDRFDEIINKINRYIIK